MAKPTLTPASSTPTNILPSASLASTAFTFSYPFGIYGSGGPLESEYFASGASDQVAFTYKRLGGDVLDIELTEGNVFAAYEEAVLEYSYIIITVILLLAMLKIYKQNLNILNLN